LVIESDLAAFTGDVLEWVRSRIRSAHLVVADLTDANPNVYLEVGYAWGVGIPTVLVVKNREHLKFNVGGQRCLEYKKIKDLEDLLTVELKRLQIDT
jgi:nucleoside 2-deoxyribosyltransferase